VKHKYTLCVQNSEFSVFSLVVRTHTTRLWRRGVSLQHFRRSNYVPINP